MKNFIILEVSLDEDHAKWLKALGEEKLPWPNARSAKGWDKSVEKIFEIYGIPTNYLIDPNGYIIKKNIKGDQLGRTLQTLAGLRQYKNVLPDLGMIFL